MGTRSVEAGVRVLVFCPFNQELFGATVQSIFRLEWEGPLDVWFGRDNPHRDRFKDIIHSYERGRQIFLVGDWEALMTVESDMIVPADALRRLARAVEDGAMVAYGLYCWRDRPGWNVYTGVRREGWPGDQVTELPNRYQWVRENWGRVVEVTGLGFGCALIQREALERIQFRVTDEQVPDSMLAREAIARGWPQVCDLGVVCGHIRRNPVLVLWPDPEEPELHRKELPAWD